VGKTGLAYRWGMVAILAGLILLAPLVSGGREVWRSGLIALGITLLFVGWAFSIVDGRIPRPRLAVLDVSLLVYLISTVVAASLSADRFASSIEAIEMVSLGVLFFIIAHVRWRRNERVVIVGSLVLTLGLVSLYGVYQHYVSLPATALALVERAESIDPWARSLMMIQIESGRAFSTFRSPNGFAGYIGLVWPLAMAGALTAARRMVRWVATVIAATAFLALLLTYSRGGIVCALAGAVILVWFTVRIRGSRLREIVQRALLLGLLCVVAFALVANEVWKAPPSDETSVTPARVIEVSGYRSTMREKVLTWSGALNALIQRPVLGNGPGRFREIYLRLKSPEARDETRFAHNHYLELAVGIGIPGALAFLILVLGSMARLASGIRPRARSLAGRGSGPGGWMSAAGPAILAGLVAILLHLLIDWDMENAGVAFTVWALLGFAASMGVDRGAGAGPPKGGAEPGKAGLDEGMTADPAGTDIAPARSEGRPMSLTRRRMIQVLVISLAILFAAPVARRWRADALDSRASQLLAEGRAEEAIFASVRAITIAPASSAYRMTLADAYGAEALETGRAVWRDRAVREYGEAARLNPSSPFPPARLGRFLLDWAIQTGGTDMGEAIAALGAASDRYPESWWLRRDLGYAHMLAGELGQAERELERSLTLRVHPETLYLLGRIHELTGRVDEAYRTYETLLDIAPGYADVEARIGSLHP